MHRKVTTERIGVEDFIRLTPRRQNLQCSLIAGIRATECCDDRILDQAKENLTKSFSVVGISERFEESLMLMAQTFDWEIPFYENRKVSKTRPQIDPGAVEMIRDHNRLDLELYDLGKVSSRKPAKERGSGREGLGRIAHGCRSRVRLRAL